MSENGHKNRKANPDAILDQALAKLRGFEQAIGANATCHHRSGLAIQLELSTCDHCGSVWLEKPQ